MWETEYQIQAAMTTVEEQKCYKNFKKSPKSVTPEWRERFNGSVKSRYTIKKGRQAGYGNHGFSNKGITEYNSLECGMNNLGGGLWVKAFEASDSWTKASNFNLEWKDVVELGPSSKADDQMPMFRSMMGTISVCPLL